MTRTRILCTALFLAGAGCKSTTSSENIRTPGIAMGIVVTAPSAESSTVRATIQVGDTGVTATYVNLEGGDRLLASIDGGEEESMQPESEGVYETGFATGALDTEFKVNFDRTQDDDAPNSVGNLPGPFDLTALTGSTFSRTEAVEVTWDPSGSGDPMNIAWNGDCVFLGSADIPGDSGTYTLAADTIDATGSDEDPPPTCDVTLTVTRTRSGTPDTGLDPDSYVRLEQVRSTSFTSAP